MATRLLLVRHGSTVFSAENRFAGSSDIELSDEGRALAERLAQRLSGIKLDALYCSDMRRTVETCRIIGTPHGMEPILLPEFREIDHGHWEGMVHEDVEQQYAEEYRLWCNDPLTVAPPGGESGLHVVARALPALLRVVSDHDGQTVLVVSHKATNRLMLCMLLGIDPRQYRERFEQDLACLNVIEFQGPARAMVVSLNDTSHY